MSMRSHVFKGSEVSELLWRNTLAVGGAIALIAGEKVAYLLRKSRRCIMRNPMRRILYPNQTSVRNFARASPQQRRGRQTIHHSQCERSQHQSHQLCLWRGTGKCSRRPFVCGECMIHGRRFMMGRGSPALPLERLGSENAAEAAADHEDLLLVHDQPAFLPEAIPSQCRLRPPIDGTIRICTCPDNDMDRG